MQSTAEGKGCALPHPRLVARMSRFTPHRTDKAIGERFGISYSTWRKLMAGEPVRATLMERLEQRVATLEAASHPHG